MYPSAVSLSNRADGHGIRLHDRANPPSLPFLARDLYIIACEKKSSPTRTPRELRLPGLFLCHRLS